MSAISKFRVNGFDTEKKSTEFYFKVQATDAKLLCNFCVADEGVYYYRINSRIMTPGENKKTRGTVDGFISMENLKELFEMLITAKLHGIDKLKGLKFKKQGKTVIIEEND